MIDGWDRRMVGSTDGLRLMKMKEMKETGASRPSRPFPRPYKAGFTMATLQPNKKLLRASELDCISPDQLTP